MKYAIEYNEKKLGSDFFAMVKQTRQAVVSVEVITAHDCPVGFRVTLSCLPKSEKGRDDLIKFLGAYYQGNNVWETPS